MESVDKLLRAHNTASLKSFHTPKGATLPDDTTIAQEDESTIVPEDESTIAPGDESTIALKAPLAPRWILTHPFLRTQCHQTPKMKEGQLDRG